MNYADMAGLSKELQLKLDRTRPPTLARAATVPGITPAALSLLAVRAKRLGDASQSGT
jgi:tRNA uridine 5-carboxymethylaminomethyl modification enzyme